MVYDTALQAKLQVAESSTKQWHHWPGSIAKIPAEQNVSASAPAPGGVPQTLHYIDFAMCGTLQR